MAFGALSEMKEWKHIKQACILRDQQQLTRNDDIYQALRSFKEFDGTQTEASIAADQQKDYTVKNNLLYYKYFDHDVFSIVERLAIPKGGLRAYWLNGRRYSHSLRHMIVTLYHDSEVMGFHSN